MNSGPYPLRKEVQNDLDPNSLFYNVLVWGTGDDDGENNNNKQLPFIRVYEVLDAVLSTLNILFSHLILTTVFHSTHFIHEES